MQSIVAGGGGGPQEIKDGHPASGEQTQQSKEHEGHREKSPRPRRYMRPPTFEMHSSSSWEARRDLTVDGTICDEDTQNDTYNDGEKWLYARAGILYIYRSVSHLGSFSILCAYT